MSTCTTGMHEMDHHFRVGGLAIRLAGPRSGRTTATKATIHPPQAWILLSMSGHKQPWAEPEPERTEPKPELGTAANGG